MVLFYSNYFILFEFVLLEAWIPKTLAPRKSAAGGKLGGNCLVGVVNAWVHLPNKGHLPIRWARSTKDVKRRAQLYAAGP
jgi:hypothetical protein